MPTMVITAFGDELGLLLSSEFNSLLFNSLYWRPYAALVLVERPSLLRPPPLYTIQACQVDAALLAQLMHCTRAASKMPPMV